MIIKINKLDTKVNLIFFNDDLRPVRIWEFHNSWGWFTIKLIIRTKSETIEITKRKKMGWTVNSPTFFEILPNSQHETIMNLLSGEWEIPDDVDKMKNKLINVKCILEIPFSLEAEKYDAYIGVVESNEAISNPPHRWLLL